MRLFGFIDYLLVIDHCIDFVLTRLMTAIFIFHVYSSTFFFSLAHFEQSKAHW